MQKIIYLAFILLGTPALAAQDRGAGKQSALDFSEVAHVVSVGLQNSLAQKEGIFDDLDYDALLRARQATEVEPVSHLCKTTIDPTGGSYTRCLDAQYLPELHRIEFSELTWGVKSCIEKAGIVMHELGRASGNENGNYWFSSRVSRSEAMHVQCDLYEKNKAAKRDIPRASFCEKDVAYLKAALEKRNKELRPATYSDIRLRVLTEVLVSFRNSSYGKTCAKESAEVWMQVCLPLLGEACFHIAGQS